jgi:hypothetical protein
VSFYFDTAKGCKTSYTANESRTLGGRTIINCHSLLLWAALLYRRGKQIWNFAGSEGSLPCSQQPNNCPYLKPDKSLPRPLNLFINIHFNKSAPPTSGSSNSSLSFRRQDRHNTLPYRHPFQP